MTDTKRLYKDFHAFWKRFLRYLKREGHPHAEYIAAAEPQGRGAWHLHVLLLFPEKAPFIPNAHMAKLWGHGFTKTKSLKGVDNPGLYLTAYLGDMELTEALSSGIKRGKLVKVEVKGKQEKAIVKGARLKLYPPGFNLYRCSRGVKRPEVCQMTEQEAQAEVSGMSLTYEKTISITDEGGRCEISSITVPIPNQRRATTKHLLKPNKKQNKLELSEKRTKSARPQGRATFEKNESKKTYHITIKNNLK